MSRHPGTVVLALDAGTTSVRTVAFGTDGRVVTSAAQEFTQHFPRPGWVEHDADEILAAAVATLGRVADHLRAAHGNPSVAAIGITNQRETVVAWDARTGRPRHRALVWQDRRTASRCDALHAAGHLTAVRATTGLVLDPYFSGTKIAWLLDPAGGAVPVDADLRVGTVDSWLVWHLTGGPDGGAFVTDPSNASRTLLYDIVERTWSPAMADLLGVPLDRAPGMLAEVRPSSGRYGHTAGALTAARHGVPAGVPVSGIAGDQQAALFGQACTQEGMAKNTYGTGSFVLMHAGTRPPAPVEGLLTTVAWQLGDGTVAYALEGSIFVTGAAVQWLRDGLGVIERADEVGPLAESVPDTAGVVVVPAFAGLGSPYWDPYARGAVLGITRGVGRAHLARAVVESMVLQTCDVITAMQAACAEPLRALRVDGGASVMDLLCQLQADHLGVPVSRPVVTETTALGAAFLAGLAEGVWADLDAITGTWSLAASFSPDRRPEAAAAVAARPQRWAEAVRRARGWARADD
jgi:glycerol kinase